MHIKVWADFTCQYCMIGKKRLQEALQKEGVKDAEIEIMSYLLNPDLEGKDGVLMIEHIMKEYGRSREQVQANFRLLEEEAAELGIPMHLENTVSSYTRPAHRLFQHLKEKGLGNAFFDLAQAAQFEHGQRLSDRETLVRLAGQLGVARQEALSALDSAVNEAKVMQDHQEAVARGLSYVPHYLFSDGSWFEGDVPMAGYQQAIRQVLQKEN